MPLHHTRPCRFQEPPSSCQGWGSRQMVPVDAFYLWPTLEDASQTPLTGRGCHGPSGPYYGRPGEQTRTTIESIHLFIKVGRDCRRLPCVLSSLPRSIALWPRASVLCSSSPTVEPTRPPAGLHLQTRTLCRVILAGASCKSFLESQPAPRQGTAVEKSCRDPLAISTLSPSHPPPEIHSLVDICPFCWLPLRPGRNPVSAVRSAGTSTASLCGLRRAVKTSACRKAAGTVPQESPGLRR